MVNLGQKIQMFGITIDSLDMAGSVDVLAYWLRADARTCRYVVTPNVDHVVKLETQRPFREAYKDAALVLADGRPVVMASKMFGKPLPGTVPGSDLVPAIFDRFESDGIDGLSVFLLGAAPGVAERAAAHIHAKWPRVKVIASLSPSFGFEKNDVECEEVCRAIADSGADLLVVGLGAPKQELWVHKYAKQLPVKVALCVGATIDFLAGEKPRAPMWMRKCGVEWLHRAASEPRRLAGRYFKDALVFPQILFKEWRTTR
ncbi:N-acetyl-mannosamine transferase [Dechloromonas denitrificans]|uniref:N-acetyl-mannosamine transferase n=2 Tax=Dechloromonas denitrificans TaxID=281362 RepID=A0A133XHV9_9RHOO|nr:N-acetyl-mannosamine transferase [Dechloromonas denitrificans]